MPAPPVTPAESSPKPDVHISVDWLGAYGSPCRASVIAYRANSHVSLMFHRSEFTFSPPNLQPRAARELAAALIAGADAIDRIEVRS